MARRSRLAARRKTREWTQESLAYHLHVARNTVARWEQGLCEPEPWNRGPLADALDVTLDGLDGLLIPDAPADAAQADVSAPDAEALRADVAHLVDLDGRYGGDDVLPMALRLFRTSHRQLTAGLFAPGSERDLQAAVGEAGEVAAWTAYDANRHDLSRRLNHEALLVSRLAGDRSMELFTLSNLAMLDLSTARPAEALAIADHALGGRPAGRLGALFGVRRARALAQMGQRGQAIDEINRARVLLSDGIASSDPSWSWWFDNAEMAWHEAQVLVDLGEWARSIDGFRTAYETRSDSGQLMGRTRVAYNDLAHLLDALTAVGSWDDAAATITETAPYVKDIGSSRTVAVLARAIDRIRRAGTSTSLVDQADDLRQLLTA